MSDLETGAVDMVLYCPKCGTQHIDAPEESLFHEMVTQPEFAVWDNPPHKSHLCHGCGHIWRPSDTPTNGVIGTASRKDADTAPSKQAVVYPPDGTTSPFTVINLGHGQVQMGDSIHDDRLPALWFGKEGKGMGHEEALNRRAKDGETIAVVTFSNVEGLDVLLDVILRIRRTSFPDACAKLTS